MSLFRGWLNRIRRWWVRSDIRVWYHPAYRLPITSLEAIHGLEARRADFAVWYLIARKVVPERHIRKPDRISWADIARVHEEALLESLTQGDALASVFQVETWDLPVSEVMDAVRLACGGTLEAARYAIKSHRDAVNLLGGFHHASPDKAGPLCPVNDIAIAIRTLREEGFDQPIVILDLDAHPPDGLADCLEDDAKTWIGSLSGCNWGELPKVDETVLPIDTEDEAYLQALSELLQRMPQAKLAFVIAGGDVLAEDKLGGLGVSMAGVYQREKKVTDALLDVPTVWVPGGGYSKKSWQVLAGTATVLATRAKPRFSKRFNPMQSHFRRIAGRLEEKNLGFDDALDLSDIAADLGFGTQEDKRFLGYYTREGAEYAFFAYGILDYLRRMEYDHFSVEFDTVEQGDRLRLFGKYQGEKLLLVETILEKQIFQDTPILYIHWLTLRNPRATFDKARPCLPGQKMPGLGLAKESSELFGLIAGRLKLEGLAFRPAWYHVAYTLRRHFRFYEPKLQGQFEAIQRDLSGHSLLDITRAITEKRVLLNGEPYQWNAEMMIYWLERSFSDSSLIQKEKERASFSILPAP